MRFLIIALSLLSAICLRVEAGKRDQPNILFILIDDLGWKDVGYMGSHYYETPNIDKLAASGVVFTNAYASAANCAPSRACIMSGQYGPRHGIYTVGTSERGKSSTRKLIPTPNTTTLADSVITLAEVLKASGYHTASMGKWHLGEDPRTQGFDINVGGSHAGHPFTYFSPYRNVHLQDGSKGEYLTDRLTSEAIGFIRASINQAEKSPFFLYLSYFTVHSPLQGKAHLVEKYRAKKGEAGQNNPAYAAMVESADENIGRLMNTLEETGLSENTLVVFFSDNGGVAGVSSQKPLRAGKGSYYEGGIREPLIIKWPSKIPAGKRIDVPVSGIDFYPTICEAAGMPVDNFSYLDGESLLELMCNQQPLNREALFWHFPIYLEAYKPLKDQGRDPLFRTRPGSVVRKGKWKLHEYFEDGGLELYNLETDTGEACNLKDVFPQKAEELHRLLKIWRKSVNAPVPEKLNPQYNPEL